MAATFSVCSAGAEELPAVEPELAAGVEDEPGRAAGEQGERHGEHQHNAKVAFS